MSTHCFAAQVVDIVQSIINLNFTTLVQAVTAADLVSTLKATGPFTVFAPTDVAFAKLPTVVVNELTKAENKMTLSKILLYHVQNGNVTSAAISAMTLPAAFQMLGNGSVIVSRNGSALQVNNAVVTKADVYATNGIIHAIDAVLLPPFDIVETAITNGNFQTLVAALRVVDLVSILKNKGPFTVFAPTDVAFAKLSNGTLADLLKDNNKGKLINILKYHVFSGRVTSTSINGTANVTMLAGGTVTMKNEGGTIKVNNVNVTVADVSTTNGLIHVIDTVLMPSEQSNSANFISFKQGLFNILVLPVFLYNL